VVTCFFAEKGNNATPRGKALSLKDLQETSAPGRESPGRDAALGKAQVRQAA
jgi:hypothetical protein